MSDIHCVTTWSRYDNQWEGLATRDLLDACRPRDEARFVVLHSHDGYTTNLALEDFAAEDALLAHSWSGAPLEQEHGGPVRLVVPHLYFWKSAKWLQSIEFLAEDAPGYWEVRGYHNRGDPWPNSAIPATEADQFRGEQPVPTERFQFTGEGGHQLAAALDTPDGPIHAYALFAHCFTCGKDVLAAKRIATALAAKGIAVLRFDFTGLGSSEGDFANSTFSSNVADLVRAADHLRETRGAPAILIGHSLGGAAILAAAGQIPDAKAVVTIAAPSDPAHVTHLFKDRIEDIRNARQGRGPARRPAVPHQARIPRRHRRARPDGARRKAAQGAAGHAFADRRHRRDRQRHEDLRRRQTSQELCVAVGRGSSAERTGATPPMSPTSSPPGPSAISSLSAAQPAAAASEAPRNVVVRETRNSKFQQTVTTGPHQMLADEPVAVGGEDSGPGPV